MARLQEMRKNIEKKHMRISNKHGFNNQKLWGKWVWTISNCELNRDSTIQNGQEIVFSHERWWFHLFDYENLCDLTFVDQWTVNLGVPEKKVSPQSPNCHGVLWGPMHVSMDGCIRMYTDVYGVWLVVDQPTPLKKMTSSVGMMTFPTEWKKYSSCSKPPTRYILDMNGYDPLFSSVFFPPDQHQAKII